MPERKVINAYNIWRNFWGVTFTPKSLIERLAGGRTIRVKATSKTKAIKRAKERIVKLSPFVE